MTAEASTRRRRRWYAIVGVGLVLGYLGVVLMTWPKPIFLPIPVPNGYDDIVRAGKAIPGLEPMPPPTVLRRFAALGEFSINPRAPSDSERREQDKRFLADGREALALLRVGLGRESVVPVSFEPGRFQTTKRERRDFQALARLLSLEARQAVEESRPVDAARAYLDMVRLARAVSRGGFSADVWVGNQIEIGGLIGLGMVRDDLDAATCRRIIAALRDLDLLRENVDAADSRDRANFEAENGKLRRSLNGALETVFNHHAQAAQQAAVADSHDELVAVSRLVQVELAIRACRLETGTEPATLSALVPAYLPAIPPDPFSGRPPVYRQMPTGHILYSVGADRVDDGGLPRALGPRLAGDLFLDSLTLPHTP